MSQRTTVNLSVSIQVLEQENNNTMFDLKYLDHCRTVFQLQQKLRAEQKAELPQAVKDDH